jgi:hypothetical protein
VANSGVITALDGDASQYVRGDGTLADFPTSTGGGSSVSYYLNSSVSQGTIGGVAYRQLGKTPIAGAGTDIVISTTGYIASYITDANDPALLEVPAGNFNCEFYFSVNNNTGNPFVYAEVYKYDGTTFTLLGTSVGVPEYITEGTVINPYYFAVPVSQSVLSITDRIAIRIYVNVSGRTVTLHTENNHLCQVVTTFSKGLTSLNNLTRQVQFFGTGTSGTDFNISSVTATHTFNLPIASAANTGKLSSSDWSTFNNKQPAGNYVTLDTNQTITAAKTFSGAVSFNSSLQSSPIVNFGLALVKGNTPSVTSGIWSQLYSASGSNNLIIADDVNISKLQFQAASNYDYTYPAASGTIALTSNLSSYVPYTGATANVNLGIYSLTANQLIAGGASTDNVAIFTTYDEGNALKLKGSTGDLLFVPYFSPSIGAKIIAQNSAASANTPLSFYATNFYFNSNVNFGSTLGNGTYTYTLPSATGTLALTSQIPSITGLVPYTGATANVNLGTFDLTADVLTTDIANINQLKAVGSGGISFNSNSGTQVALMGAGGGAGTTFYGEIIGTNATFSTDLVVNGWLRPNSIYAFTADAGTTYIQQPSGGNIILRKSDSTPFLTIANSGAATFSSSVSINSAITTYSTAAIKQTTTQLYGGLSIYSSNGTESFLGIGNSGSVVGLDATYGTTGAYLPIAFNVGGSERVRILTNGNVGIGTSSPSARLTVATASGETIRMIGADTIGDNYMSFYNTSGTRLGYIGYGYSNSNIMDIYQGANDPIIFTTNDAERMRIHTDGQVSMNTSSVLSAAWLSISVPSNNYNAIVLRDTGTSYSTGNYYQLFTNSSNTIAGSIAHVTATTVLYNTSSDYRLKEDFKDFNGLEILSNIKFYDFKWKNEDIRMHGVIAHELQEIVPLSVSGTKDELNDEGNIAAQGVDYSKLVPILGKAIQELKAEIEELKAKIK